jgi:NAD-dependent deacetylase
MSAHSNLETASRLIADAHHVVVLTGAGISAESGLPTFRGAGGLWRGMNPMELATPQAFERDPKLVWEFYNWRRELLATVKPNPGHLALVELARIVPKLALVTQNVDRLHHRAGSHDILELHGNLDEVRCVDCAATTDRAGVALPALPKCDDCGGLLRPAVVWFGEALPQPIWESAVEAAEQCDVMLVVGTSAVVYPAAGLGQIARGHGAAVIEVNLEQTDLSGAAEIGLYGRAGEILPTLVEAVAQRKVVNH